MKHVQPVVHDAHGVPDAVRLMWTEGELGLDARESDVVIEEISARATEIGPVLEGILHESHTETHLE
jgi:hypothetical protein